MKTNEAQLRRIARYESLLDEASSAVAAYADALARYEAAQAAIGKLERYYTGRLWKKDFADDEAGRLPRGLKRGVLSEDAVYDLLEENRSLRARSRGRKK